MKNYEEVAQDVFCRRDEYNQKMAKRKKTVTKVAVTFSCFCVVAFSGFFMWKNGEDIEGDSSGWEDAALLYGEAPTGSVPDENILDGSAPDGDIVEGSAPVDYIVINDLSKAAMESAKMAICLLEEDFISMSKEELNAYYGINVFPEVPFDLPEVDGKYGIYQRENGTGEIYWNQNRMIYATEDRSRSLDIEVCKGSLPLTDMFFLCEMEKSIIQGNEVEIGTFNEGCYYVEMIYENVGFRINALGFSEEEILSVITSILQ